MFINVKLDLIKHDMKILFIKLDVQEEGKIKENNG